MTPDRAGSIAGVDSPKETRVYRAGHVFPVSSPVINDGGIAVRDGIIIGVGGWKDISSQYPAAAVEDLGDGILMPGIINAHCHLDYTMMRGALLGGGSFSGWIQRINAIRRSLDQADFLASIASGMRELRRWGCTSVLNIESFPELIPMVEDTPLRIWWFLEVMDIRSRLESSEALAGAINFFERASAGGPGFGISPHAPYTVSRELFELVRRFSEKYQLPVCTHLAESEEELAMFTKGEGKLYEFLRSLGRSMDDCGGVTPVQAILTNGLVPEGSLLVHMNALGKGDRELLQRVGQRYHVIHCPRTHAFFKRPPFDMEFFLRNGIPVLLGTDSLASNQDLNMFAEMRAAAAAFPWLSTAEVISMATVLPAAAIGRAGQIGELSTGSIADFIMIPGRGGSEPPEELILANDTPPRVWISGQQ